MIKKQDLILDLQKLQFSQNEATVYCALVELGHTSAGSIINKTGFHRNVVYEALNRLIERKLAFKVIRRGISYFQAADPGRITESANEQLQIAQEIVPNLKSLLDSKLPEITIYEGPESYRRFWLDSVKKLPVGSTDYVAGSIGAPWVDILGKRSSRYFEIAQERKISWKLIVFDVDDTEQTFLKKYPDFHWECRLIDKKISKEGNFNVFGDESVILHSTTEPMIVEIKNKSLVRVFRNIFDLLWESGIDIKK